MSGMILSHTNELVNCIVEVRELMNLKSLRMADMTLAIEQRSQAGKDLIQLISEYNDYTDELNEITENYIQRDYWKLESILDPYLSMLVNHLIQETL